jgi:hypothetical protein
LIGNAPLFVKYPDLHVAHYARNHNHTGRQTELTRDLTKEDEGSGLNPNPNEKRS